MITEETRPAEETRLAEDARREKNWKRWGPYLAERQWSTVREDYSAGGDSWNYFTHEMARSRAYRWGEDGLLGITDREGRLAFALALWNGRDPFLKERLFGLTGPEGNHGEDVKECYFYLDATPTTSYAKALYKYPQAAFPYERLREENQRRGRGEPEFELADTGVFDEDRYFDVLAEYSKAEPDDILIRITVTNRGPDRAALHVLPTLWFRNTWAWGRTGEGYWAKPRMTWVADGFIAANHESLGCFHLRMDRRTGVPPVWRDVIFTENESNAELLFAARNASPYVKDAFHRYVCAGDRSAVNPALEGTKAAHVVTLDLAAGETAVLKLRLTGQAQVVPSASDAAPASARGISAPAFGVGFDKTFAARIAEADAFYAAHTPAATDTDERAIARQAWAGLLWNRQFFHFIVSHWLDGDPASPPPPAERLRGRNHDWAHLYNRDVISMPDKWEYPWYAAWDLAFHMIPFARIDPVFAKEQLVLFLREWYLHPNGQIPAYEFEFSDVNPPVHAWAAWRVYKMTAPRGTRDRVFLARVFQKLLLNFTWWVNRKDRKGNHIFAGGFLGLDNIGVFDRSRPLPGGAELQQADGTAWMAFYCLGMLSMALELGRDDPAYQDIASKFFEHFVAIADAMNRFGGTGLWDETDGFYYDELQVDGREMPLRVRSMVGLVSLFAVEVLEEDLIRQNPGFMRRLDWFTENRPDLAAQISVRKEGGGAGGLRLLAIPSRERLARALRYVLDESEFLSPYGVRSLSQVHRDSPFRHRQGDETYEVSYIPGESASGLFGGNSNWRGPIWLPMNYLLIESLERYHHYYGDSFQVECPTGSGNLVTLEEAAREIGRRLNRLFTRDHESRRACHGDEMRFATDPHWRDLVLFHEYFHGDTGRGLGASHQTGWTALVANLIAG